jgi:Na+-translocating ferredoxin:NAD+ oxidoreductase RnfC subunit
MEELRVPLSARMITPGPRFVAGAVKQGDALVERAADQSHWAIAPVDGEVEGPVAATLTDGRAVPAVRLRRGAGGASGGTSGAAASASQAGPCLAPDEISEIPSSDLGSWIDRLRLAGVWADRWTSPDLLAQLTEALRRPIDSVICNVLDVDPTLPLNTSLAANHPEELLAGVTLLARLTSATRVMIAIDANAPIAWTTGVRNAAGSSGANSTRADGLRLLPLINDYPQADPSLLLYALLNRRLRPSQLPAETGSIVVDAQAAIAMGNLALHGRAMVSVPLAVRDHIRGESHFCTVPVGTPLAHVLRRLGLPPVGQLTLRGGDVLRDIHINEDCVIGGSELVVHANAHEPPINPDPCVRCGWCFEVCPTYVQPANCLEAVQQDDPELATRFGIEACIDCGICSYVCPSHLPILAGIRQMRERVKR